MDGRHYRADWEAGAYLQSVLYPARDLLAQQLCTRSGMDKVFFGNSGAEANEAMIKVARKYSFDKYGKGRSTILTLNRSFHGRTITTLTATGQESYHNYFFPFNEAFRYADPTLESIQPRRGTTCARSW